MLSPSTKRRRLRESPLLEPLSRRVPPPCSQHEASSPTRKPAPKLSHETRRRWMLEALETLDTATLSLALQQERIDSPQHRRTVDSSVIDSPSLVSADARAMEILTEHNAEHIHQSSTPSPKYAPVCDPGYALLPLPVRRNSKRSPTKLPHRLPLQRRSIGPLISREMLAKLEAHLAEKIRGSHWQNEVRSRLARPLSASVFSNREEQLRHPLTANQFLSDPSHQPLPIPQYPYSVEAHVWSARIGRMYRKHCYRRELLAQLRRLACAIRFFRRVVVPWLVRAHRRRRRAAIKIQRQLRHFLHWRHHVLRPFVERFVAQVTRLACLRAHARVVFSTKLRRLVRERRERETHARARRRVLFRWVAKTRVALFVHTKWCPLWFRGKRERNLARLRSELAQLEASDVAVHREYSTIFGTGFGRQLLKKELVAWRQTVKRPIEPQSVEPETEAGVSDAVVRLRQCFLVFDLDGSGALDLGEFELMLAHLRATVAKNPVSANDLKRAKLTTAQVRDLFDSLDRDGDGTVTRSEFEAWWTSRLGKPGDVASGSASVSLLATGLDRLVLTGHGMLFWLLGKKQQLERKFVKKRMVKSAQDSAKRALLESWRREEAAAVPRDETRRCDRCGRRYGLQRDLDDHRQSQCLGRAGEWVVDPFLWKKWVREEELRLLEDAEDDESDESEMGESASVSASAAVG